MPAREKNGMADAQEMSASAQVTTNIGLPFYVFNRKNR